MTGSSFASVNIRNSRILVVDDNRVNRHLLVAVLQRGGFPNVGTAEDGIDALAKIEEVTPDLILLDLMMPRMDGFEVCRQVRANPAWKDLPISGAKQLVGIGRSETRVFRRRHRLCDQADQCDGTAVACPDSPGKSGASS